MENREMLEEGDVHLVNSVLDLDLASMSSTVLSMFGSEDFQSTTSISGETLPAVEAKAEAEAEVEVEAVVVPRLVGPTPSCDLAVTTMRQKCVGRNKKGVTWGFTSVIGRRREMEDAVAVIPGFMSRTCDHVGGCTAPGSKSSGEISPIHFFGVYDGHGGSQVAKFCAQRMHEVVAEEWDRKSVDGLEWHQRWEATFANSFERADNEVVTKAAAPEMVGSTAVVVVLSGCQIIASNCGDSRAVLCRGTETIPLTVDQKVI